MSSSIHLFFVQTCNQKSIINLPILYGKWQFERVQININSDEHVTSSGDINSINR